MTIFLVSMHPHVLISTSTSYTQIHKILTLNHKMWFSPHLNTTYDCTDVMLGHFQLEFDLDKHMRVN